MKKMFLTAAAVFLFTTLAAQADELKVGEIAPHFSAITHDGSVFDLNSRKGKWTVLYFYPKAETPGCTKQACAFRDNLKKITALGAAVFGVSADTKDRQAEFHKHHKLNFTLLADPDSSVIKLYDTKMPIVSLSKRWTFILDPELVIRGIDKDVDPVKDALKVAAAIQEMQAAKKK